jgi:hypothetical protein
MVEDEPKGRKNRYVYHEGILAGFEKNSQTGYYASHKGD